MGGMETWLCGVFLTSNAAIKLPPLSGNICAVTPYLATQVFINAFLISPAFVLLSIV